MPKPTNLDEGKRNRLQNGSGPVSLKSSGSQLGTLRGSQECPIRENVTRAENNSRREQMGPITGRARYREKFLIRSATVDDRNH